MNIPAVLTLATTSSLPPSSTTPPTSAPASASPGDIVLADSPAEDIGDVVTAVFEALSGNGYQTGVALIVATFAIVAMVNVGTHRAVIAVVSIGAFWAGWLGYNTVTNEDNQLFPGEVSATKLWDIALTSDKNFLLVAVVGCIAAIFLWRSALKTINRVVLMAGAVLGASFLYNLYEAFRDSSAAS